MQIPSEVIKCLKNTKSVVVLTGAGVSKESGIPTFREAQTGLWAQYDPMELATPEAFQRNPRLVWEWYEWRRTIVRQNLPNPAHYALVELEERVPSFTLITQNVDGYHEAAGSKNIIELHGNIMRTKRWTDNVIVTEWDETEEVPPRCPETGSLLRPDVVWFGENLPPDALDSAINDARNSDIFLSVGTSSLVQPAASLPVYAAQSGAVLVEINPAETPITPMATYSLQGVAGLILPELIQAVWGQFDW